MPQTLRDIKQLLAAHGLRPKHRLGQNFLHDHNQMAKLLDAADVSDGDVVLEVGPGTGALTERLLRRGARVVAVEIDRDLEPILLQQLEPWADHLTLLFVDVLADKRTIHPAVFDALRQTDSHRRLPTFKLIANLPYSIASPLLINLAAGVPQMTDAVVMVQKEVADRIRAEPGGKTYGPLSVMLQAMCDVQRVTTLSPGCFWPQPEIDSAVIRLTRKARPPQVDPHALSQLLQTLFSRRRKQIGSILGRDHPLPAGVTPTMRPEQLDVEQLTALARLA